MSLVDPSTGEIVQQCTPEAARELTDQIRLAAEGTWELIKRAYETRAWAALGYSSWDDYLTREFGTTRLRLPREKRQEVVASLRDSGLSIRAISTATGNSTTTIQKDLGQVSQSATPGGPVEPEPAPIGPEEVRDATGAPGAELQPRGEQANASPPRGAEPGRGDAPGRSAIVKGTDGKRYSATPTARPSPAPVEPAPTTDPDAELKEKVGEHLAENAPELAERQFYRDASQAVRSVWSTLKEVDPEAAGRGCRQSKSGELFMDKVDALEAWLTAFRRAQNPMRLVKGKR